MQKCEEENRKNTKAGSRIGICPRAGITKLKINNFKNMKNRKIEVNTSVTVDTTRLIGKADNKQIKDLVAV